ncbi:hypothetical protein Mp_4g24110 [Marchantia polymorpha subsp. ruderalis]|uniref:holo-[acyl-carrier-protein] synthase n=5 Tax=Marchantia polymorpha TaxID=3197 RepID=A0AAF6BD89_MARPO|nr:hypothetical protein MARPO_0020s0170 [Marchantia polymorpha]BBN09973.1 hypothetical protein Mp_4g24110 [Marchantia polymorpha subsp. ruderalis]|eukprot:PTQ44549.1 hypothetical protein MARPO_0020s0170 [Marchantia polymorpha]
METGVQRWAVNVGMWSPSEAQFSGFVGLLPIAERPLVLRYVKFEDKKKALVSRLLQRKLVHSLLDVEYGDIVIERTREGKPYLANQIDCCEMPNFNFNVSHQGNFVVLASEPLCIVGVDVMTHQPVREELPVAFFEPFKNCYTDFEWNMVMSAGPKSVALFDQFYRLWCLKEAYIKAIGIGLGFDLLRAEFFHPSGNIWSDVARVRIDCEEKEDWIFCLHKLDDDHWACVAKGAPEDAVESYRKTLQRISFDSTSLRAAVEAPEKQFRILEVGDLVPHNYKMDLENSC